MSPARAWLLDIFALFMVKAVVSASYLVHMSGYTGAATDLESLHSPDLAFLPKPFTQGELLRKIRDMLAPGPR